MIQTPQEVQQQCLLLMLPAELRNAIYAYILIQPIGVYQCRLPNQHLQKPPPSHSPRRRRRRFCANILLTCKQINREGSPILYGENIFSAHSSLLATLPSMLLTDSPSRATLPPVLLPRPLAMIRRFHIYVRLDTDPRFDRQKVRQSFSNAEELELQVFQAIYGSCDFSVLELFEDVRGVGRAKVGGSVGDGRYAAWLERTMMTPGGMAIDSFSKDALMNV